jgi:hypothetical protein
VFFLEWEGLNVVLPAVIGLSDYRELIKEATLLLSPIPDQGFVSQADLVGVGEQDRGGE